VEGDEDDDDFELKEEMQGINPRQVALFYNSVMGVDY